MKALQDKNQILWLVVLIVVLSAIAVYRIGFHVPVPAFDEKAITSLEQGQSQEAQIKPNGAEPAPSLDPPESVLQPSHPPDPGQARLTQRRYRSQNPLYFRVAFGAEGSDSMLGIIDESAGTGTGYDVAYVDENMNGDLTDEAAKKFSRRESGSRAGELDSRFEFTGPFKPGQSAKYTLNIYSLSYRNRKAVQGNDYYFFWFLDVNQWNYFFINGKISLFSNAADALRGTPVRLGGPCRWEISSRSQDGKPMISAGLKDTNGCTLRIVRRGGQTISPTSTLVQNGQIKAEEKMKFG
jgi:hypothetical protein